MSFRKSVFRFLLRNPRLATHLRRAKYLWWKLTVARRGSGRAQLPAYIDVDPNHVLGYVGGGLGNRFTSRGTIDNSNWGALISPFRGWDVYKAIESHYRDGIPWSQTAAWRRIYTDVSAGRLPHGASSCEDYFERIEELWASISEHGYKRMAQVPSEAKASHWDQGEPRLAADDVTVAIGSGGELLLQDGKHRLSIAQIQGISSIPVAVGVRHGDWVKLRNETLAFCAGRGGFAYQQFTHPDLQDIPVQHKDDRHKMIEARLDSLPGTMLDLGAYFGFFDCYFGAKGWRCTAVEHHPKHAFFIRQLCKAGNAPVEVVTGSFFDLPSPRRYDVVLALNIFHHYLATEELFSQLKEFIRSLIAKQIFFEPHLPEDAIVQGAYRNFTPDEFVSFVSRESGMSNVTELGSTSRGRRLFLLERS